ncbi:hypothetical protein [Desulfonatronum lacustre]|uniref:hypothetical protein n=1 Tax=Desulfonatronum lacustre TaxID=66849 RepID=UPI00048E9AC4|nr:hypothetical protein [Desulfonatronum lacustre]
MQQKLTKDQIKAFLHYGYVPRPRPVNLVGLLSRYGIEIEEAKSQRPEKDLVSKGAEILDDVFKDTARKIGNRATVVPISGGMDSRAILAGILQHLPKEQVQTVTVGIPGALDYEIGQKVTQKSGIANKAVNLDQITWNEDDLISYASKYQFPIALIEGFLFSQIFDDFRGNPCYLSGFMGDPLSGSHLPANQSTDWPQAKAAFIQRNNYTKLKFFFPEKDFLPSAPLADAVLLTLDEQLDFFIRQRCNILPLVLLKGYQRITPFLYPRWIEFMLNLPHELRNGQFLYKKILQHMYPDLFSLPLKNLGGLPLGASRFQVFQKRLLNRSSNLVRRYLPFVFTKPSPGLNYIDFEKAYREKPDLKTIAEKSLNDLHKRNIVEGIRIPTIWQEHQSRRFNHSQLITLLASLEIFFKAAETKANEQ